MRLEALVTKYIISTEKVLKEMRQSKRVVKVSEKTVSKILDYVTNYFEDAKYYKAEKKFETSLTSVAYCEGLLDALRLLGAVEFEWPAKTVKNT
jgi:FAD synthetase